MKCYRCMWPEEMRCLDEHCDNLYDPLGTTKKLHEKCSKNPDDLCSLSLGKLMKTPRRTFTPNKICFKCHNKIDGFKGFHRIPKEKYDAGEGVVIDIHGDCCLDCYDKR